MFQELFPHSRRVFPQELAQIAETASYEVPDFIDAGLDRFRRSFFPSPSPSETVS